MNEAGAYTAQIRQYIQDSETYYEATFKELGDSLSVVGNTPVQAVKRLYNAGEQLVEDLRQSNKPIPSSEDPEPWDSFSGKITVRISRGLHYKLRTLADEQGVSLNAMISEGLGWVAERKHLEIRPAGTQILYNNQVNVGVGILSAYGPPNAVTFPEEMVMTRSHLKIA